MRLTNLQIPLFFAVAKFILHLFVITFSQFGYHRDELLYLALGKNLDWGFWSNPPFIGLLSFFSQNVFGESVLATRLLPAFCGSATLFLTILMVRDLGGKKYAQLLAGVVGFTSIAYLRSSHMFQPVVFDIFFWALASWLVIKYLSDKKDKWLYFLGITLGIGFLNKYSIAFLIAAMALSFLATKMSAIFLRKDTWYALGIAFLIVFPNLIWQWKNGFPVIYHMQALRENQLTNVSPLIFLLDQLLMQLWGFLVWLPGVVYLLANKKMEKYRSIGWLYIFTLILFLVTSGKNYYTLGIYPMTIAAGAVFWEDFLKNNFTKYALTLFIVIANTPMFPAALPILSIEKNVQYFDFITNKLGIKSLTRWEGGNIEPLPQDYADMLGWEEIGALVNKAIESSGEPERCFIYGESYGHAGSVLLFVKNIDKSQVVSFSDVFRLWAPLEIQEKQDHFIYINDELGGDVANLFNDIKLVGEITNPYSRQLGDQVYLCRSPKSNFSAFWRSRVEMVKRLN